MRKYSLAALAVSGVLLIGVAGCATNIPPRLEVRDVSSGRTYTTYKPWGQVEKGVGYSFTDIETGNHITLTNYEVKTVEGEKSVPNDSADAKAFQDAMSRGGVKK